MSRLLLLAAAALFVAVLFGAYAKRVEGDEGAPDEDGDAGGAGEGGDEAGKEARDLAFGLAVGGVVVAAGLAASWAMAEHASTGIQPGIAMPVDVLHLLAVAAWLGGLTVLLVALHRAPAGTPLEATAVRRFSQLAFGSVLVLVVTGLYQSWRQVGSWSALTGTRYGQLLCLKAGLVVLLVGIAWISRRWTGRLTDTVTAGAEREKERVASGAGATADADSGTAVTGAGDGDGGTADTGEVDGVDPERAAQLARQRAAVDAARQKRLRDADPTRSGLRRSVLAEAGVAVVLLAVTTMLTSTEPGRTEEEAKAATAASAQTSATGAVTLDMPFDTGGQDGKGVVRIDLDPARTGANALHVYVTRPNGRAFDVPEVKVAFTLESQDIGPLPVVPDHITTGHWSANGVQIPMAGEWKIAVTVRTSDIDQVTVDKNTQIG
ncbi:Integral membrane protein OS=Streptomyces glaucescens OX=1907 GN=SGLAU_16600 PE=4 SV=1 [Streptomyces glaucescens]